MRLLSVGVVGGSPGKGAENGNASIVRAALAVGGDGVKEAVAVSGDNVEIYAEVPETLLRVGKSEVATPAAERPREGASGRRQRASGRPGRALERPGGGPLPELASTPFYSPVHSPVEKAPRGNKGLH